MPRSAVPWSSSITLPGGGIEMSKTPTELRLQLLRLGYLPLPLYGKEPPVYGKNNARKGLSGWTNLRATPDQVLMWDKQWPDAQNSGVLTAHMPTFDGDITHAEAADAVASMVRERYEERGVVLTRTGRAPKFAIPFHTSVPFPKIVRNFVAPDGSSQKLEFLCKGQLVVVDGTHPDTGKPYGWHGGTLIETPREELPHITAEEAQQLINDAADLLVSQFGFVRTGSAKTKGNGLDDAEHKPGDDPLASPTEISAALALIPNDVGWDDWNRVGMAVWRATGGVEPGFDAFDVWSRKSEVEVYDAAETRERWMHYFKYPPTKVGAGTIFYLANQHAPGWRDNLWRDNLQLFQVAAEPPPPCSLDQVHGVFRKWFGGQYDLDACDVVCAVAASEQLSGDPVWLMMVSGAGTAKTETVQAVDGAGAHVISTITSDGALLSATEAKGSKQKKATATGGLLRKIGERGTLVIKDFTSILSSDRNVRAAVLAAFREIYDGRWVRNVGSDGGQTIEWRGRIVIIAAVTTAWDAAHAVIAAMGDRFVLLRIDSRAGRLASGQQALRNAGSEMPMREELAATVGGLITHASTDDVQLTEAENNALLKAADVVTLARTAVERDYAGNPTDAHAPEMPTRFAKQLAQIVRGGVAIGMTRERALALALRCARDSIPPLRLEIMLDVADYGPVQVNDVSKNVNKPWHTVKRELSALTMLGIVKEEKEQEDNNEENSRSKTKWRYSLLGNFDRDTLIELSGRKPPSPFKQILRGRNR
jgi:DNA-binding transcriptional ArsR family regulator